MSDVPEVSAPEQVVADVPETDVAPVEAAIEGDEAPAQPAEETPVESKKPEKDWVQHRIDQITRKKHEAVNSIQAQLDQERQLRATLEARLNGSEVPPQDVYAEAEKIANQRITQQRFTDRCNDAVAQGEKAYGDEFASALTNLQSLDALFEDGRPTELTNIIVEADNPAKLLHYLGTNKNEAARILALSPVQQARAIGALEARLETEKETPRVSKAPAPVNAVTNRSPVIAGPNDADSDAEWLAKRNAQIAEQRKRK